MTSPPLSSIAAGIIDADFLRTLAATNREALESLIAVSIDILDAIDGDTDSEEEHDGPDEVQAYSGPIDPSSHYPKRT